jgi:hypothetical protein
MARPVPALRAAALALAASALLGPARAAPAGENYGAIRIGAFVPRSADLDPFPAMVDGEIAVGRWFTPALGAEIGVGAFRAESAIVVVPVPDQLGTVDFREARERLEVYPLALTVKLGLPAGRLVPYLLAGGDVSFASGAREPTEPTLPTWHAQDVFLGWHAGLGVRIDLDPRFHAIVEGRWAAGRARLFHEDWSIDGFHAVAGIAYDF